VIFFFQAEDGIRDRNVTGVQTCALPILRMQDFISLVEDHYDMVIIDLAPVLEVSDTQELARRLDGVILIVRQGKTQKAAIKRAVEMLNFSKAKVLGFIMNDISSDNAGYGYGYGYGYGEEDKKKKGFFSGRKK